MAMNNTIKEFSAKKLEKLGVGSFKCNQSLQKIDLPNLKELEHQCFEETDSLTYINLPKVKKIGRNTLSRIKKNIIEYVNSDLLESNRDNYDLHF